jgi:type IV pilus assembly protein PilE
MIALLVLSILTGLAIPSYQRYLQRGHRAEAVRLLLAAAACQERMRTVTGFYDTTRCLEGGGDTGYVLSYVPADRTATMEFTLFAEPPAGRAIDDCGTLSLDQSGRRSNSGGASAERACWAGR